MDARSRQVWERQRQREWEMDQNRFEELSDSDPEAEEEEGYGQYDDLAYGDDYDELSAEYEIGSETQRMLRAKEDALAERALRRIQRARLQGESSVDLSREELDALEKRRSRQGMVPVRTSTAIAGPAAPAAIEAPPAKASRSPAAPAATTKGKSKARESPRSSSSKTKSSGKPSKASKASTSSPISEDEPDNIQYYARPPSVSPVVSRTNSRNAMRPANYEYINRPGSSGSLRSLPDDPDWTPSRPRSSSQAYRMHNSSPVQMDPMAYQVGGPGGRRIVSEPMQMVSYSQLRRNPPAAGGRSMLAHEIAELDPYEGGYDEGEEVQYIAPEASRYEGSRYSAPEASTRQRHSAGSGSVRSRRGRS